MDNGTSIPSSSPLQDRTNSKVCRSSTSEAFRRCNYSEDDDKDLRRKENNKNQKKKSGDGREYKPLFQYWPDEEEFFKKTPGTKDTKRHGDSKADNPELGPEFEYVVTRIFFLLGLNCGGTFKISSNNSAGGKWDDVVYEEKVSKKTLLIQLKHVEDTGASFNLSNILHYNNKKLGMAKYFESYLNIKTDMTSETYLLLCMNAKFVLNDSERNTKVSKIDPTKNILRNGWWSSQCYEFTENIIPDLEETIKKYIEKKRKNNSEYHLKYDTQDIRHFLKSFFLVTEYPDIEELKRKCQKMLADLYPKCCPADMDQNVKELIAERFKEGKIIFSKNALHIIHQSASRSYIQLNIVNLNCQQKKPFDSSKRLLHIVTPKKQLAELLVLKIYQELQIDVNKSLYLNCNADFDAETLINTFIYKKYLNVLIISDTACVTDSLQEKLAWLIKRYKTRRVIIITQKDDECVEILRQRNPCLYECRYENLQLSDFSKQFMHELSYLRMQFGSQEHLNSLLSVYTVVELLSEREIKVGYPCEPPEEQQHDYYVPRSLSYNNNDPEATEEQLIETCEKLVLIAASSGMGKTTILASLAAAIKKKSPHLWVIRVDLQNCVNELPEESSSSITLEELLRWDHATQLNSLEKDLLSSHGSAVLILDGLDDVSPRFTHAVVETITELSKRACFVKIFVAAAPHNLEELEGRPEVARFNLLPLSEDELYVCNTYLCN